MTRSDFPEKWHDLFAGYALGNLTPAEQAELAQLLQATPNLQQTLREYEAALAQLPQALDPQVPGSDLEERILQAVQPSPASPTPAPELAAVPLFSRPYWWALGGAITAGIWLLLGVDNLRLRQAVTTQTQALKSAQQDLTLANDTIQDLQQQQDQAETVLTSLRNSQKAVYALEGTGDLATAAGSVVTLAGESKAILVAHNLPPLPADQVYRFWADVETAEALMYCGEFTPQDNEPIQWSLPSVACTAPAAQVLITIDPVTASTESGGELVMHSLPAPG